MASIQFQRRGPVARQWHAMACELITANLTDIADDSRETAKTIHECRKRCKRLRALLRLGGEGLPKAIRKEEKAVRDAARLLSGHRDATAMLEAIDKLQQWARPDDREYIAPLAEVMGNRLGAASADEDTKPEEAVEQFRVAMEALRLRAERWSLESKGYGLIEAGLTSTYRAAKKRWRQAESDPSSERLHEWRKEVKYHRYQIKMLEPLWPAVLGGWHNETVLLSEDLGDEHDLTLLSMTIAAMPEAAGGAERAASLAGLAAARRAELRELAFERAARLFVERPKDFNKRIRRYWKQWRRENG